jgi:hypothetical protein
MDFLSKKLNALEDLESSKLSEFSNHPVIQYILRSQPAKPLFFDNLLLQRRFISHSITNIYDLTIDATSDIQCKKSLRRIVREEYPGSLGNYNYPSHREDLVSDLIAIGIPLDVILRSRPTEVTKSCIESTLSTLLTYSAEMSQIKVLAFTRFIGEVLVGEEYKIFWPCISEVLGDKSENRSRFFWNHIRHDSRIKFTDSIEKSSTHASDLGIQISSLIGSKMHNLNLFAEAEHAALLIKLSFYNQFLQFLP